MDVSPIGCAALEGREGNRLTAYKDTVGVWTISTGITTASGLIKVVPGLTITPAQSDALFAAALEKYVAPVRAALSRPVPQPFFDACVSLAYNIGPVGFAHSTVVRRANAGDLSGAVEAFLMWNKPSAIISRRQGERDQAALASYDGAKVYARRGDRSPVKAMAGKLPEPARAPDPLAPMTAAKPPVAAAVPIPVAEPGFWARLHALLSRKTKVA